MASIRCCNLFRIRSNLHNNGLYGSIYSFSTTNPSQSSAILPGYTKPLPLDVRTGKLRRDLTDKQKDSMRKRNKGFRRYLTSTRRHMARELLFGYAATRMMNKLAKGANQKRLQKELINHLYALKLNSFRLPFMDIEDEEGTTDESANKRTIRLTRRLRTNSSWNRRQKKKGGEWTLPSRNTKIPKR